MTMKPALTVLVLSTLLTGGLVVACAKRPVAQPSSPADLIVVLPEAPSTGSGQADDSAVGPVSVSNTQGAVDLRGAWQSTQVSAKGAPTPATTLEKADVERMFRDVLAGLPPPPQHFTLYFQFGSDELTSESRALTSQILQIVKTRPYPDVIVVGHTDTTGAARNNDELGRKRALIVRNLLVAAGLEASFVEVTSHGERDLLIKTPDETYEARNRRVEVDIQ
jgi:peptidoglycan-associated lipoprotein